MFKPNRLSVFLVSAVLTIETAWAQSPAPPQTDPFKADPKLTATAALLAAPARPPAPPLPGVPQQPEDLLITTELGGPGSGPVVITNKAELNLALEQLQDVHHIPTAQVEAIQKAYETVLAGMPTKDGSVAVPSGSEAPKTSNELAVFLSKNAKDAVPEFPEAYAEDAIGDELDPLTLNRRDAEGVPNTSLIIRRYAGHLLQKYDKNEDGKLEREEWEAMPGKPQAIDLNGDFVLEDYEILYYLAAYAKGRTITHPVPPRRLSAAQTVLKTDGPILIHPLSSPIRKAVSDEEETDPAKKPADLSPEEFARIVADADKGTGTEEQSELFGIITQETGASAASVREYAPSANEMAGIPNWFLARDANGDGQLTLREFSPALSLESTAFFGKLDGDGDGLVTPDEVREYLEKGPRDKQKAAE